MKKPKITLADALEQQAEAQRRFDAIKSSLSSERAKRLEQLWQANQVVEELTKKQQIREERRWEQQKAIAFARLMDARAKEARAKAKGEI